MERTPDRQRIIVIRDHESSEATKSRLIELGFDPISIPLVSYKLTCSHLKLSEVLTAAKPQLILLASQRACGYFYSLYQKVEQDPEIKFLVVGERAEKFLKDRGLKVSNRFQDFLDLQNSKIILDQKILYPCSREKSSTELELLKAKGFKIMELELYDVDFLEKQMQLQTTLEASPRLPILVYSSSQARALSSYPAFEAQIFCLGRRTHQSLKSLGFKNIMMSQKADEASLLELLSSSYS